MALKFKKGGKGDQEYLYNAFDRRRSENSMFLIFREES